MFKWSFISEDFTKLKYWVYPTAEIRIKNSTLNRNKRVVFLNNSLVVLNIVTFNFFKSFSLITSSHWCIIYWYVNYTEFDQ